MPVVEIFFNRCIIYHIIKNNVNTGIYDIEKNTYFYAMKQYKYFNINEFIHSETALVNGIDNYPKDEEIFEHLEILILFLDKFRDYYGKPIKVTSGYRCKKLNDKVGGVKNSGHISGYAADIIPVDRNFFNLCNVLLKYINENNVDFDLIIIEKNKLSRWIHISVDPRNRKQIFKMDI